MVSLSKALSASALNPPSLSRALSSTRSVASTGVSVPSFLGCIPSSSAFLIITRSASFALLSSISLACARSIISRTICRLACVNGLSSAVSSFGPLNKCSLLNPAPYFEILSFASLSTSSSMVVSLTCPVVYSSPSFA